MFPFDTPAEGVLVGMEDEMPYRDGVVGESGADLALILLDQDSHGHHQSAAGVIEYAASGLNNERPPRRPMLEVVGLGQPRRDVHKNLADLLGVEHPRVRNQLLQEGAGCRLADAVGAAESYDHEPDASGEVRRVRVCGSRWRTSRRYRESPTGF